MKLKLSAISAVISVIVLIGIQTSYSSIVIVKNEITNETISNTIAEIPEENNVIRETNNTEKIIMGETKIVWQIEIPAINLKAEVAEGTSSEVMNEYVGHFENTQIWERKCRISCT